MKRLPFIAAAAIASSIGTMPAAAQYGHHGHYGHYAYRPGPPVYYYPRGPVFYGDPLNYYERPPVVIERAYEPRFYEPVPLYEVEQAPRMEERSYAQVTPPPPQREAPRAAPRLQRYTLSANELFEFDKATLREPQPKLDEIAQAMKRHPEIEAVTITGHTDRLGSESYNRKLSQRRAEAVKSYLVARGVEARRLAAVGKGESMPVVQCGDKNRAALVKCLEPNRRVEVEQITIEQRAR